MFSFFTTLKCFKFSYVFMGYRNVTLDKVINLDRFIVVCNCLLFTWGGASYEAIVMSVGIPIMSWTI